MNLETFGRQVEQELHANILPFHAQFYDEERGGFYGRVEDDRAVQPDAPKGLVQHSRILWAYAHAYRTFSDPTYLNVASRAYAYLLNTFWDAAHKGMIWLVDAQGRPLDKHKIIYGQAFAIYGLSEYFLASGEKQSLDTAAVLFEKLEEKCVDPWYDGYFETFEQDWRFTDAFNIDQTAEPTVKSMNTHLHLLEAYTNLLRAWDAPRLRERLRALMTTIVERVYDRDRGQMKMHFAANWRSLTEGVSYGHDIEVSWLLVEAAEVLSDKDLLDETSATAVRMAQVVYDEALNSHGSLRDHDQGDERTWWVQAEAMVGFLNAFQLSGKRHFLDASAGCWRYIQDALLDRRYGEWIWGREANGSPIPLYKAGLWKTPYHNGRACMEVMRRIEEISRM